MFRKIKLYREYIEAIKKHELYLINNYGLERNIYNELSSSITLVDAPEELINNLGIDALAVKEIKTYILKIQKDLEKLELNEILNIIELKRLDKNGYNYGITLGYNGFNVRTIVKRCMYILGAILIGLGILIIF